MNSISRRIPPLDRRRASKDLSRLRHHGITSFSALVTVVGDETAPLSVRQIGCWALAYFSRPKAVAALLGMFQSKHKRLRWEAASALNKLGHKAAIGPLRKLLAAGNSEQRAAAAYALGGTGQRAAVSPLIRLLRCREERPATRGYAAEALARLSDRRATVPLIEALGDASPEVRFWAAYALGELGDARALPRLREVAANDRSAVKAWGSVSDEAGASIIAIEKRTN